MFTVSYVFPDDRQEKTLAVSVPALPRTHDKVGIYKSGKVLRVDEVCFFHDEDGSFKEILVYLKY